MRQRLLTPSMAVALLALLVALGGTSYAAASLAADSVGPVQLRTSAVTSLDVKNGSLKAADFAAGQLPAGPAGVVGPEGPAGAPGSPAFAVTTGNGTLPSSNTSFSLDGRVQAGSGDSNPAKTLSPNVDTVIANFRAELDAAPPVNTGRSFQLRIDDAAFILCNVGAGETSCNQTAPVAVPAGSTMRLVVFATVSNGASPVAVVARWGMTIGTA